MRPERAGHRQSSRGAVRCVVVQPWRSFSGRSPPVGWGWYGSGPSRGESGSQRPGRGSVSRMPAVKSPGSLPLPVLGSREGLDRAGRGRRREDAAEHRLAAAPGLRLGAREHPHAPRGVAEVLAHAPLDQGRYGWCRQLEFDLGLGVHRATVARAGFMQWGPAAVAKKTLRVSSVSSAGCRPSPGEARSRSARACGRPRTPSTPRVVSHISSWDHRRNWSEYPVDGFPGMTE